MTYDTELASRLRAMLSERTDVVEKRMFGGLAFLVAGHLAVSASSRGGLLLRVDPAQTDTLVADLRANRFEMRGRAMDGWLHVAVDEHTGDDELRRWLDCGLAYLATLPPK